MAARFWVGGTGTWDATTTANWSATSGGAGGASVPGAADDVTINTASITVTTDYNVSVISVTINASAATLSLGGTLTCSGVLTVTQGTFTTNNFNVTAMQLLSSSSSTREYNLGSSTFTISAANAINIASSLGLTFNAGTSSILLTGNFNPVITITQGATLYNVSFTGTGASNNRVRIGGPITFNDLTITGPSSVGVRPVEFDSRTTINGTLSTTGTAGNRRVWFRSDTYGIARTLTINSAPSLTDADFRDIYVIGTAAPISGTRIGDLRGCRGITFDAPKTVYWNLAGAQNWSANGWSDTSTGTPSTDFFPLAQDTATFTNAGSVTGTITLDAAVPYTGTVDMSGRTSAMTLGGSTAYAVYGNWVLGSGVTQSYSGALTFSGRNTQTITSAGKTFSGDITVDSYGGTLELADALNIGTRTLTVTNGTFDTKGYNVTAGSLSSSNSNVRTITLGSSTVTLGSGGLSFATSTNLTFNAGTSQINLSTTPVTLAGGAQTFYNVSFTGTSAAQRTNNITGANTFNNLSFTPPSSVPRLQCTFAANQIINGVLTCAGSSASGRLFIRSDTQGTQRTLTVNSLSANDCDFRDFAIAGAAAGSSPTRAGDCGNNAGITFPAAKTIYAVGSGTQSWFGTIWALTPGGTVNVNNFPLAQDTAVINNTSGLSTININYAYNIGTADFSAVTTPLDIAIFGEPLTVYGDWKSGTGCTYTATGPLNFAKSNGTQTLTNNGVAFTGSININAPNGTLQLADALVLADSSTLITGIGTFDAVSYNVTIFSYSSAAGATLKMGSGTWTLTGTGTVWSATNTTTILKGTANIVLSNTSTTARTFAGGGLSYNKLTIGGATGTSTLTITGNNTFTELASTKTVAHTIALGTTTQTFGAWTVTGTAGNVVTVTGTGTSHVIAGARVSGVDYLAMGTIGFAATSPGEFYAGANSTGSNATIIKTAAPAAVTRYWRGGTGTWDATTTTNWSATSGGLGGASVPTSADAVVFDTLSNATAYTVTCTATQLRCGSLTMAGPLVGNVTWAGTAPIAMHDNVSLAATGITRTYTGVITLSGSATGKTFTTNGVTFGSEITVNGVGCSWTLGSALNTSNSFRAINGTVDFAGYAVSISFIVSATTNSRTLNFGASTITLTGSGGTSGLGTTESERANLTVISGTSQLNLSGSSAELVGNNQTFYNVAFTSTSAGIPVIRGINTFNNLSVTGITSAGLKVVSLTANQTINGTLTLSAGTNATMRTFVRSDTIGTTRTLTCAAFSGTDADFRDITIAGAAAPVSGTRLGDCKGNSGITFVAGANKYWNLAGGGNWSSTAWATSSGGSVSNDNFPLAQDTCIFEATGLNSGASVGIDADYNVGTVDMSARTTNTMSWNSNRNVFVYGNWINGTGTTIGGGSGRLNFVGRGSQTITSAGRSYTQSFTFESPGGTVTLQDALSTNASSIMYLNAGTFDANGYNVTISSSGTFDTNNANVRTLAFGAGTWVIAGGSSNSGFSATNSTNLTVTGTATVSLTRGTTKAFNGGSADYSGITVDQGGGGTLTISGDNTFANITNSYKATGATTIALGNTTQTVGSFTASGEAGRVLTVTGTSATSPATLVFTGSGQATAPTTDYLTITGVRAYSLDTTWYAGANSTNNGSLGWYFEAGGGGPIAVFIIESATSADAQNNTATLNISMSESTTAADAQAAGFICLGTLSESATVADAVEAFRAFLASVAESATSSELVSAALTLSAAISELTTGSDQLAVQSVLNAPVSELASMTDSLSGGLLFLSSISEATTAQEIAASVLIFNRAVSEATTASEVLAAVAAFNAAVPESVSGSEVANALVSVGGSINEALTALDAAVGPKTTRPTISEAVAASESTANVYTANPVIAETASPLDAAQVVASTFSASSAETASLLDAAQGANTGSSSLSESATVSEAQAAQFTAATAISEASTVQESQVAVFVAATQVAEAATIADTTSVAPSTFGAIALAAAQAAESFSPAGSVYNAALPVESAGITDFLVGAYLWNPIDDNQTPNWQNVNNAQGSGWVSINTDDAPNWQPTIQP